MPLSLEDAMTQGLASSFNPMTQSIQSLVGVSVSEKVVQLDRVKREFVKELEADLATAITAQADDEVLASIRRLIKKHSS